MHEASIVESIFSIVRNEMAKQSLSRPIEKITFSASSCHMIVPDSLHFYFEIYRDEDPLFAGAQLEIISVPMVANCIECAYIFETDEVLALCPQCGSGVRLSGKEDMRVESFIIKDEEQLDGD